MAIFTLCASKLRINGSGTLPSYGGNVRQGAVRDFDLLGFTGKKFPDTPGLKTTLTKPQTKDTVPIRLFIAVS